MKVRHLATDIEHQSSNRMKTYHDFITWVLKKFNLPLELPLIIADGRTVCIWDKFDHPETIHIMFSDSKYHEFNLYAFNSQDMFNIDENNGHYLNQSHNMAICIII